MRTEPDTPLTEERIANHIRVGISTEVCSLMGASATSIWGSGLILFARLAGWMTLSPNEAIRLLGCARYARVAFTLRQPQP